MMIEREGCSKYPCPCDHQEPCDRGWIWVYWTTIDERMTQDGTIVKHTIEHDGVRHCPTCRPERAALFNKARSAEEYQALLRGSGKPQTDEPKTRIL